MPDRSSKRPKDQNQLAKLLVDQLTGESRQDPPKEQPTKNPAAVALGRLGGLKGGNARAKALSPKKRKEIARRAAVVRWGEKKN